MNKDYTRGNKTLKFNWKIFTVALIFSLVVGALSHRFLYLALLHLSEQMFDWLYRLITVISFIISPLLLFASFYLIGRKIDLASDFLSVLIHLFTGSWAGQLIGGLGISCIHACNNDFYLAKKWLSEHPDFTDLKRRRIEARN